MSDINLALLIDRLMRSIQFGLQARAPDFDREAVGPGGGIVLMTLADTGQISLHDLTKRVARDKSQMTRMIRSLETKGLVTREPSAEDGRVSLVALTPKGEQIVGELMQTVAEVINDILEPISETERATLRDLLARVV
ncbi:MarR family winged helix-turn-helix transcriptional regulator [Pacificoceanicola onchidii]|uniref:MarR family winged helix-turn-helix transcriptional regulator n=1 Tax=Pacificoceanicola onchidii TaxID=2562685 RepID=UPI0010A65CE8|nr:MarR family transcriptional regulator [Pacificoceanicola onchidii]